MASREQKDTAGWKGARGRAETWAEFDGLPVELKALYWYAPYPYTAAAAVEAVKAGYHLGDNVRRQRQAMRRDMHREIVRVYGPTHPQVAR